MGLCQSDPRPHTINIEVNPNVLNTPPLPAIDPNIISPKSRSESRGFERMESDYLFRTNINLNDIHQSQSNQANPILPKHETYMELQLPPNNKNNPQNQNPPNVSFSNTDNMVANNDKKQDPEKKTANFLDNMVPRASIYHRRISQLMMMNPLSQLNLNNTSVNNPSSQNVINEENPNKMTENSNEEESNANNNSNISNAAINKKYASGSLVLNRGLTSKFLMESAMSLKKSHDFSHDPVSRYNLHHNTNLYESKIFQNMIEEQEQNQEELLYVITIVTNPCQNSLKTHYYEEFAERMEKINNVRLITAEVSYMGLPFILTQPHFEPFNIQIRVQTPLNLKYNILNYVISKLPQEAEFVAWVDFNIEFLNENWVQDTLEILKNHNLVKLYKDCLLLNKDSNILGSTTALIRNQKNQKGYSNFERIMMLERYSGTAWAARKEFITSIGGFLDLCVTNENDEIISSCLEGKVEDVLPQNLAIEFAQILKDWQKSIRVNNKNEEFKILNNVLKKYVLDEAGESPKKSAMKNSGSKNKNEPLNSYKKYDGWALLVDNHFNPLKDLTRDGDNVYQLKRDREKVFKSFKEYYLHSNDINFGF